MFQPAIRLRSYFRHYLVLIITLLSVAYTQAGAPPKQGFYSLRIYQLKSAEQETRVTKYLQDAYLPALHRLDIPHVGVFTPVGNDTAAVRKIYVLVPLKDLDQLTSIQTKLDKDQAYQTAGKEYIEATYDNPAYLRQENILLQAFPLAPQVTTAEAYKTPAAERIYELRSYEGPTESYFANKVKMFNTGDEVGLFKRLGFNAIFYGSVLSGAHMPNLMYMTSFENMASREAHWKAFGADPYWKELSAKAEYQHNVSHIDIVFLHPASFSDL